MIFTTIPFTYLIRWSKYDINYYGVRYARGCKPEDLWTQYFTSSNRVQECRELYGEPDIVQVRQTFEHHNLARAWEHRVLTRINAVQKSNWLNEHAGGKKGFRIRYGLNIKTMVGIGHLPKNNDNTNRIRTKIYAGGTMELNKHLAKSLLVRIIAEDDCHLITAVLK